MRHPPSARKQRSAENQGRATAVVAIAHLAQRPAGGIRRGPHHLMLVTGDRARCCFCEARRYSPPPIAPRLSYEERDADFPGLRPGGGRPGGFRSDLADAAPADLRGLLLPADPTPAEEDEVPSRHGRRPEARRPGADRGRHHRHGGQGRGRQHAPDRHRQGRARARRAQHDLRGPEQAAGGRGRDGQGRGRVGERRQIRA